MKKEMIDLGYSIADMDGNRFDVFCESLTFKGRGEELEVVVEYIELVPTEGELLETIVVPSLSEMPDRFSQKQVNALEEHILSEERISQMAYEQDLACDLRREV